MSVFSTPIGIAETLLANLPVGILVYEGDTGNCVLAGQAVADLLGVSVESLRQENFQTFASRCRLAESALHDRSSGHHEAILQTAFNKIITLDIFISWFDFEGKPHVLCTVSDISESNLIPVVVLTSSRESPDLEACYRLGVNAYVVKPVRFIEFVEAVKQIGVFWALINQPPPNDA